MADDKDDAQKTEQPTPKKLQDARDKGQVASSKEVGNFFILAMGTLIMGAGGPYVASNIKKSLAPFLTQAPQLPTGPDALGEMLLRALWDVGTLLALPFLALMVAAVAAGAIQNSILWTAESMKPKLERISLIAGLKRLFGLKSLVEFIKSILKITIVSIACGILLWPEIEGIVASVDRTTMGWLGQFNDLFLAVLITACVIVSLFAGVDYAYQQFEFMKQMRMTMQEVKDEHKLLDGDPQIKQRLRQLRMEKASQRMMAEVPSSTVVITNPTHYSIALKYERSEMNAPIIVAMGIDELAMRIRHSAKEHDVPMVENPPLARALYAKGELGQTIPIDQYQAVAEIIGYVMRLAEQRRRSAFSN